MAGRFSSKKIIIRLEFIEGQQKFMDNEQKSISSLKLKTLIEMTQLEKEKIDD
jgi:hypothetical protein